MEVGRNDTSSDSGRIRSTECARYGIRSRVPLHQKREARRIDALVDESGIPMRDSDGKLVPSGFKIRKVGTDEFYTEAIDVENAPWSYVETDVPCEEKEDLDDRVQTVK